MYAQQPNETDPWRLYSRAAIRKDGTEMQKILSKHPDMLPRLPHPSAARFGGMQFLKMILERGGIDPNAKLPDGSTPLHCTLRAIPITIGSSSSPAAAAPKLEQIKLLLQHGSDATIQDSGGISPFAEACIHKELEIMKVMLQHGVSPNTLDGPLLLAMRSMSERTKALAPAAVQILVDHGADVDAANQHGETPLLEGIDGGSRTELVEILLPHSRRINHVQDARGETLLLRAVKRDCLEIVLLLLRHGANPDIADRKGTTPLMRACQLGQLSMSFVLLRKSPLVWDRLGTLLRPKLSTK